MDKIRSVDTLPLDGGALCFHFINTVYAWKGQNLHEYLGTYEEVVQWCAKVDILGPQARRGLLKLAEKHPSKAAAALQRIKKIRRSLYRFFSALATHQAQEIPAAVLKDFNATLSHGLSQIQFSIVQNQCTPGFKNAPDLLAPVWVVMKSAYDILTLEDLSRIKECPRCGWIFFDNTKNNMRRWCSPSTCGSADKSKKYYSKKKKLKRIKK